MKSKWSSSEAVQTRVLDAAMHVFKEQGYSEAKLTDIVQAADVSIGSIYHHFGGKDELFAACYERLRTQLRAAVGIDPAGGMPEHGTWEDQYLWAIWDARDDCAVFLSMNAPPSFEPGQRVADYYRDMGDHPARILGSIVLEAMRILCECQREEAEHVISSTVKLLNVVRAVGF